MTNKIPDNWELKTLSEVGDIIGGGTPNTTKKEYWNGNILWVIPSEVTSLHSKYLYDTERKITELGLKNSSAKIIKPNSLIICTRATIGNCCINKNEIATNQGFKSIIPNENYDVVFLYYLISNNKQKLISKASGTTFLEISKSNLENLNFYFPPLEEQKRIASALSKIDAYLENTIKLIEEKEKFKRGIAKKLFSKEIRFKEFNDEWEEVQILEFVNKNIIKIEKGKPISESKIVKGDIPVIAGGKKPPYYHNKYNYDFPCITISASGSAGYVWFHDYKIWASDCHVIYTDNKKYNIKFLYYYLKSNQDLIYYMQIGGVQKHIYAKDIMKLNIPNIKIEEQEDIGNFLSLLDAEIDNLKEQKEEIKKIKKGVMKKLMSGEVRL